MCPKIVNRDLSIAVLRKFAAERAEEQAAAREKRRPKGQPDKEAAAAPSTEQASSTEQAPVQVAQPGDGANKESPPAKGLRVLEVQLLCWLSCPQICQRGSVL